MIASPAIADGRIYVVSLGSPNNPASTGHLYAIGQRRKSTSSAGLQPGVRGQRRPPRCRWR